VVVVSKDAVVVDDDDFDADSEGDGDDDDGGGTSGVAVVVVVVVPSLVNSNVVGSVTTNVGVTMGAAVSLSYSSFSWIMTSLLFIPSLLLSFVW
jgi:hypothetical protein